LECRTDFYRDEVTCARGAAYRDNNRSDSPYTDILRKSRKMQLGWKNEDFSPSMKKLLMRQSVIAICRPRLLDGLASKRGTHVRAGWGRMPMRIAQVAPLYERVPPKLYGGTERVVSYITEELVRLGHEVTL